ncbi:hypothetical protein GCM10028818_60040 [Spirosoma horti]
MQWINNEAFVIESKNFGAVVQLTGTRDQSFGAASAQGGNNFDHVPWGVNDNKPNEMNRIKEQNNQVEPLLEAMRDMIYGSGLGFFKRIIKDGKQTLEPYTDAKLEDWAFETELQNYIIGTINERVTNANPFTRFEFTPGGMPLLSVSDSFSTRIGKPAGKGKPISDFFLNPNFGDRQYFNPKESEKIPAFDKRNPKANIVSILHCREIISGNPFYDYPSWWLAKEWIELANLIPLFHKSGIKNGYNLKYLIKMPRDYFDKEGDKELDSKKVAEKWSQFGDSLKSWLSGVDNVNKSLLVRYLRGEDGKALDSVDVVPLKNEQSDDAYSKVSEMSNVAITNAVGLLPVLGGVTPGSKSGDSGAQIRVVADYQQHYRTPIHRHIILEPTIYALRLLGYTDVFPAFKGVQLTTLDANPNGKQAVVNQNQAE